MNSPNRRMVTRAATVFLLLAAGAANAQSDWFWMFTNNDCDSDGLVGTAYSLKFAEKQLSDGDIGSFQRIPDGICLTSP